MSVSPCLIDLFVFKSSRTDLGRCSKLSQWKETQSGLRLSMKISIVSCSSSATHSSASFIRGLKNPPMHCPHVQPYLYRRVSWMQAVSNLGILRSCSAVRPQTHSISPGLRIEMPKALVLLSRPRHVMLDRLKASNSSDLTKLLCPLDSRVLWRSSRFWRASKTV